MSKNDFLQSEKYKGQMRDESGVVRGESSGAKQMAYDEYLEDEKKAPIIKASVKIVKEKLKIAKRLPLQIREKRYARINEYLNTHPNGDAISEQLKPRELKMLGRDSGSSASQPASNVTATPVSQGETKRNMFNKTQGENSELKSGQSGGTTIVNAPKTINQQGNARTDNKFFGNKTAQDQRFADADIF